MNTVNTDANININHPQFKISIPASAVNNIASAVSVSAGAATALRAMQHMPGSPGVKAAAGVATLVTTQALTAGMSKVLNATSNQSSNASNNQVFDNSKKFVEDKEPAAGSVYDLNEFPLNLLPEINKLVTAELMFLMIILNIFVVKYISKLNYNKYIPDNKLGKILLLIINRYIMV